MSLRRYDQTTRSTLLWYGGASAALYLFLAQTFPLPKYAVQRTLYDLMRFTNYSVLGAVVYTVIIVALFGLYWHTARHLHRNLESEDPSAKPLLVIVVALAVLFALTLMWMYPINATDLFLYFFRSRILIVHNGSPFTDLPGRFSSDPYIYVVGEWTDIGSPYGPAWELLAAATALLTQGQLTPNLLGLKAVSVLFFTGSIGLVHGILKQLSPERRVSGTLLYAWNPLILLEWVGNGHNDAVMVFWILLGVWLWTRRRHIWVLPALVVAVLIKAIAIVVIPLFLLAIWQSEPSLSARIRWLVRTSIVAIAISAILFAPFGPPWQNVGGVVNEAADRYGYSLSATLVLILRHWVLVPLVSFLSTETLFTLDHYAYTIPRWLALGGLAILYLRQLGLIWRKVHGPIAASLEAFFAYLILAPSYRMWYPAWPMALAALRPSRDRMLRVGAACLTAELSVLIYGYLDRWATLSRYALGTTLTLLIPLLTPLLDQWIRQQRESGLPNGRSLRDSRQTE